MSKCYVVECDSRPLPAGPGESWVKWDNGRVHGGR
jgi:hypothetical protein